MERVWGTSSFRNTDHVRSSPECSPQVPMAPKHTLPGERFPWTTVVSVLLFGLGVFDINEMTSTYVQPLLNDFAVFRMSQR